MDDLATRFKELEENIRVLRQFTALTLDEIRADTKLLWGMRYGMLECLQIVIDIACSVVSSRNLGNPKTYGECIEILGRERYIEKELSDRLVKAVGMRNILIHEYFNVDDRKVYESLNDLSDVEAFVTQMSPYS